MNEKIIELQLWPNHYQTKGPYAKQILIRPHFFTHGLILAYDITDDQTLYDLEDWLEACREKVESKEISILFMGCKADLKENRTVSKEDAIGLVKKLNLQSEVIECSARTGENVDKVFSVLVSRMMKKYNQSCL